MVEVTGLRSGSRGCLAALAGALTLVLVSPFAVVVQRWRKWRRGDSLRSTVEVRPFNSVSGDERRWVDLTLDVPASAEPGIRRRLTEAVVRVADFLRRPDDVYNVIYSRPGDPEPVFLPVGPQLQELGERCFLVLSQNSLSARTVVWLTLGGGTPLSHVIDPMTCDPGAAGEPEGLLATPEARWGMATEWARVGPSLVIRVIIVVPTESEDRVRSILEGVEYSGARGR
jgi:hypothetical protein